MWRVWCGIWTWGRIQVRASKGRARLRPSTCTGITEFVALLRCASAGNSTVNASWGDATWSASWAESGNASWNGSEAGSGDGEVAMPELLPATGYCIMSWLGAFTFTYSPRGGPNVNHKEQLCAHGGGRSQNARRRQQLQIRVSGPI